MSNGSRGAATEESSTSSMSTIIEGETISAGGIEDYTLILKKGRGRKRAFNNTRARVVSRRVNSGGWVTVELQEGHEHVQWRNKSWNCVKKRGITLSELKDDCLVHVFSFLGAGDFVVDVSEEALSANYSEEYLAKDQSPEYVEIHFTLKDAVALHKTIALLSKQFHSLCRTSLPAILGHLDADLNVNTWWQYAPWLAHHSLRLKSLTLYSSKLQDAAILLYIMTKCDVANLSTLVAIFGNDFMIQTMVEREWYRKQQYLRTGDIVDIDDLPVLPSLEEAAESQGLPRNLYQDYEVRSRYDLHEAIANHCPALVSLKVICELGSRANPVISSSRLFRKQTIRDLHLVIIRVEFMGGQFPSSYGTRPVSDIVSTLLNLKVLAISSGRHNQFQARTIQLSSSSLQSINMVNAGKGVLMTRCVCPNLTRLICHGELWGNGVRPFGDDGERDWRAFGQYYAGSTRFGGRIIDYDETTIEFEELAVPDSCLIILE